MINTTLFELALAPLYCALSQVESFRGRASDNVYQIRKIYVDDVNRIQAEKEKALARHYGDHHPLPRFTYDDRYCPEKSERMMRIYWEWYGARYERQTGQRVTYEVLARMHNGGANGWKKISTRLYWWRVRRILKKAGVQ